MIKIVMKFLCLKEDFRKSIKNIGSICDVLKRRTTESIVMIKIGCFQVGSKFSLLYVSAGF